MHFSLLSLIIYLIIAALAGGIGRAIAGGTRGGCIVSLVLGFIGAWIGSWIAHRMHLPEPLLINVSGAPFPFLWSVVGAALFVGVVHLLSGRR
ncbi:MAG TPA: GlsB/YeaQ/YmgE family stress response membrane protein [Thermoanaerobaculia bacterium]